MGRRGNGAGSDGDWVGVDGEAEGSVYSLIADSTGRALYKYGGLNSKECFEFLLEGADRMACFGLTYDANNWFISLDKHTLEILWKRKRAIWIVGAAEYQLDWIPAKELTITHLNTGRKTNIVECWGFFQTSFVKACEQWGIDVPPEIVAMKEKRGRFTKKERERVIAYCLLECMMLSELMGKLEHQCDRVGITPRKWIGPGQLASALLEREGVAFHHKPDEDLATDSDMLNAIRSAYFGGRVEMYAQGDFEQVHVYDINSAYPAGARNLPSLANAKLVPLKEHDSRYQYALWRCRWDSELDLVTPFPTRRKNDILYPRQGEGWYHAVEVKAALAAGHNIDVLDGYGLEGFGVDKPFDWIPEIYEHRRKLKEEGDAAEKSLKLALNSLYGKLAQGVGYAGGFDNRAPRWQSYFWAGYITAWTRAKLMGLMRRQTPLMIATDGIFFAQPLDVEDTDTLGGWSASYLEGFFLLKPGVYLGWDGWFDYTRKSRGFFAKEVDYNELRKQFKESPNPQNPLEGYRYLSRRFIGMGTALHRKDFGVWLKWNEDARVIRFAVERRLPQKQPSLLEGPYLRALPGPVISEPYKPKGAAADPVDWDYEAGLEQPNIGASA